MFALLLQDEVMDCLQQIYTETNGDSWNNNANWKSSSDYCTFAGIKCSGSAISEINLGSNNLVGSLPECFTVLPAKTITLSYNALTGKIPELSDRLTSLDVKHNELTQWPKELGSSALQTLYAGYNSFAELPEAIFAINYVDVANLHAKVPTCVVNVKCSTLKAANNDFSDVIISSFAKASTIDITNTYAESKPLDLSEYSIGTFNAGNTNLTLSNVYLNDNKITDISGGSAVFKLQKPAAMCKILALRNMYLTGFAPTIEELDQIIGDSDLSFDFEESEFMCDPDAKNAAECQMVILNDIDVTTEEITVKFETPLYLGPVIENFELAVNMDINATDSVTLNVLDISRYLVIAQYYTIVFKQGAKPFVGTGNVFDMQLLYKGVAVSTGDLHYYEEIHELLGNATHETYTEHSEAFSPMASVPAKYYQIIVTGMSQCPYYTDYINKYIFPFYTRYQSIARHIHYKYVCFSSFADGYFTSGSSLHGQYEAFTDSALICARDRVDDFTYVAFQHCFTESITARKCIEEYFDEALSRDIYQCMGDEYVDMYKTDSEEVAALHSLGSPTLFLQIGDEEPFEDEDFFLTLEGFKKSICKYFSDIEECNE